MMQQAAIPLGVGMRLLAETAGDSASLVLPRTATGDYRDLSTLEQFAAECDVVTFDHEHVPTEHLRALERSGVAVRPGADALVHAQDKATMRERLTALGVPCPAYAVVRDGREVAAFAERAGWPVVLKTTRGGYDGRGVWVVAAVGEAESVLARTADMRAFSAGSGAAGPAARGGLLAEANIPFRRELAVLVARSPLGQAVAYPTVETIQRDGICHEVIAPAPGLDIGLALSAQHAALTIAHQLGVTGMLAVEMFEVDGAMLVNELAMRPHNSGHWTIEGAVTSQFEQHLRAVLDLPLGSPRMTAPYAVMVNILGGARADLYDGLVHVLARDPGAHVHLYGKSVRPGRKVGHVTVVGDDLEDVRERARHAAAHLRGDPAEDNTITTGDQRQEQMS